jgi:hypothetical protein
MKGVGENGEKMKKLQEKMACFGEFFSMRQSLRRISKERHFLDVGKTLKNCGF